jgi:hypothetical protein
VIGVFASLSEVQFAIADFEIFEMRACAPVVPNRKSTIANLKSGGSAAYPGL